MRLGMRANAAQFTLLVGLNAIVGAMVGVERSVLPLLGEQEFGLTSKAAVLSFVVAFGLAKAIANLAAGRWAEATGRRRLLVAGWALALPVPVLVGLAPSWSWIVVANLFLGASQGFTWSLTVLMKIDLVGPRRRGLALGLNESAGYLGVALTAFATGALAATVAPRTVLWASATALLVIGLVVSAWFVRETAPFVRLEEATTGPIAEQPAVIRSCAQAGFTSNLNDALAWGLVPLYLAAGGARSAEIGIAAAVYPAVWGIAQLGAGWISDATGRKPLIVAGMLIQAGGLALLTATAAVPPAIAAAAFLGVGTALVYPTLLAAVSDAVEPRRRARAVGRYRFWRDTGLVAGAIGAGVAADALGMRWAIGLVALATAVSGIAVAVTRWGDPRRGWVVRELVGSAPALQGRNA